MSTSVSIAILFVSFVGITATVISWYHSFRKNKEKAKQLKNFNDYIIRNNLTIDSKQRFNKNIIGIDRLNYVVVFLNNETKKFLLVRLKQVSDCRLIKERNTSTGVITRIYLQCIFRNKEKENATITFYHELNDEVSMLTRLSKRADYWAKRINIFRQAAALKNQYLLTA